MKTIYLASPAEPSGASWLINCFLELGLQVAHKPAVDTLWRQARPPLPPDAIWRREPDGTHRLHRKADVLKKFLPILSRQDVYEFRDDARVEYVQDLPSARHAGATVVYFVRDPRDSLYSAFRRLRPSLDYATFLRVPDADTLLDRAAHWRLGVERWTTVTGGTYFTFEEYKQDAGALLRRVLRHAAIERTGGEIDRAVRESSFDKARSAEAQYRAAHTGNGETINRAGRTGDWSAHADSREGSRFIEAQAGPAMRRLGYACSLTADDHGGREPAPSLEALRAFAHSVSGDTLRSTNLPNDRIRRLLDHLEQTAQREGWDSVSRLRAIRRHFADGSAHQLAQVRELLVQQRRGRTEP